MGTNRPSLDSKDGLKPTSIVYATDFSTWSQNAGFYAALFAKYFKARLLVAHAFTLSQAAMEVEVEKLSISQQRRDLQAFLSTKAAILTSPSVEAVPKLVEGAPGKAIPELADKYAPSLIVLGTQGRNWVERGLIGSVSEGILRTTRWPCVTVGPQVRSAAFSTSLPFRRILYATDLTPAAAHAAVYAVSFAQAFGAEIDVLNVINGDDVEHPDRLSELTKQFYGALDGLVPEHAREFCDSKSFVEVGDAHERILGHIKDRAIDLLVLGIEKSSHLGLAVRRSGAFHLIVHAVCPVLTVTS
jgi:nucleotide-binding universal stress UspA family protein